MSTLNRHLFSEVPPAVSRPPLAAKCSLQAALAPDWDLASLHSCCHSLIKPSEVHALLHASPTSKYLPWREPSSDLLSPPTSLQ
jgi:hypothetical protein